MAFEDLTPLSVGDTAPDFELTDQHGRAIRLSDVIVGKPAVIAFVPAAFTGICTGEFCELRDNIELFSETSVQLHGISCDPKAALRVWGDHEGYDFPLLSDFWPHGAVSRAYGVFNDDTGYPNRGTFVVDRTGIIRFAEMKQPGEARDQRLWTDALAALQA